MAVSSFSAGSVVQFEGRQYTLIRQIEDGLWQLEESRTRRIHERTLCQLFLLYRNRELFFVSKSDSDPGLNKLKKAVSEIPESAMRIAKQRRSYVQAVLDLPNTRSVMTPSIRSVWEKLGCHGRVPSWTTVYRWKRAYLDSGRDIRALVSDKGQRGKWARYSDEVIQIVRDAIEKVWLTLQRNTVQDVVDYVSEQIRRENAKRPSCMALKTASRRAVVHQISKISHFDRHAARYGWMAARRKFRSIKGHRTTLMPLDRVEMDNTRLDLFVLDDDTGLPLGRPTLTVCIDDYSRCILGFDISFEPPSYITVSRCLKHVFAPKSYLQTEYPGINKPWPCFGVMKALVVDNAMEFHSDALESACSTLGIEIHYAPRKTPWFKGKVERVLGSLNKEVAHRIPGTTFSNIVERGDYTPEKHAVVRLSTLKHIVHIWVTEVYHQRIHRSLQTTPASLWDKSIRPEDIPVASSLEELDAVMGRRVSRNLTHKGIELDLLKYNSPELTDLRRRLGDRLEVTVSVDDSDLGTVIVFDPEFEGRWYPANALAYDYAKGLTRWQHEVCKKYARDELKRFGPSGWLAAKEKIRQLIQEEAHIHQKMGARRKRFMTEGGKPALPSPNPRTEDHLSTSPPDSPVPSVRILPVQIPRYSPVKRDRKTEIEPRSI